jgi:hypothetical protein
MQASQNYHQNDPSDYARRKFARIKRGAMANYRNAKELEDYLHRKEQEIPKEQVGFAYTLMQRLYTCAAVSVWRRDVKTNSYLFCATKTCNHRLCSICNANRARLYNSRFYQFFDKNRDLFLKFDFFHLVLTVPHKLTGFNGVEFYAKDIKKMYTKLRRNKWFKEKVWGGFYCMEFTKGENGYHIHIHSLLIANKYRQNANDLRTRLLVSWNRITANGVEKPLREDVKAAIEKNYPNVDTSLLSGNGATQMHLESLYVSSETKKPGHKYSKRHGRYIKYVGKQAPLSDEWMTGVLECVKYHFEPVSMSKDGVMDIELAIELMPRIYFLRMFDKFGAFHAQSKKRHKDAHLLKINLNHSEEGHDHLDQLVDYETGEIKDHTDYHYVVCSTSKIRVDFYNDNKIEVPESAHQFGYPTGMSLRHVLYEVVQGEVNDEIRQKEEWDQIKASVNNQNRLKDDRTEGFRPRKLQFR